MYVYEVIMDSISKMLFVVLLSINVMASDGVAKVIQVKGNAYNVDTKKKLKKGQWLPEGATVLTKSRSFVKLLFIDKSKMSLGPKSKMKIAKFPKKEAGVISLLKGQLRSKVTKNYMEMGKKDKSKLFIKTKTAAMGVRGTDFQVNYNPLNRNTSLITFEGRVAMNALPERFVREFNQRALETVVSAPTAVMVTRGQYSGVLPGVNSKPLAPVKVNSKQLKTLESNDGSKFDEAKKDDKGESGEKEKPKKKAAMRSIIPPGVANKEFAGASEKEVIKEIARVDKNAANSIANELSRSPSSVPDQDNTLDNDIQGARMSDGGLVDTQNALYIPPPKTAAIDPITNEIIMPVVMGGFNSETGTYENEFFDVNANGEFVTKADTQINSDNSRGPASISNEPRPELPPEMKMSVTDMMKESMMNNFMEGTQMELGTDPTLDPSLAGFPPPPEDGLDGIGDDEMAKAVESAINDVQKDTQDQIDNKIEEAIKNSAKVKFNVICTACR